MTTENKGAGIALITGANKGLGLEIARQLGRQGITVIIGARNEELGREAAQKLQSEGIEAQYIQLDVTRQDDVDRVANFIQSQFGKLDILVNNAGIAIDRAAPSQLDFNKLQRTYDTNVFGAFRVTKAMLPLLRQAQAGRIVNMSSGLGSLSQMSNPNYEFFHYDNLAYPSSKAALNALTVQFAKELKGTPIKVNSADPGFTATDLNDHRGTRTIEQGATAPVRLATLPDNGPTGGFFDENGSVPW